MREEQREKLENQLREVLKKAIQNGEVSCGSFLVKKDGEEICCFQEGYADRENLVKLERDHIFRLYSMTKPITAAAVMALVEEGKLDLSEPVSAYLLGFCGQTVEKDGNIVPVQKEMRILHLLSMTSGLVYDGSSLAGQGTSRLIQEVIDRMDGEYPIGTVEFANRLGCVPLEFDPGTSWHYGTSADVLGALVEVVSGQSFGSYLRERFFEPMGMKDTGFFVPEEKQHRLVKVYQREEKGDMSLYLENHLGISNSMKRPPAFESGGAGLVSTLDDYARFTQMLLQKGRWEEKQILRPYTVDYLTSSRLCCEGQRKAFEQWVGLEGHSYGNLMRVLEYPGQAALMGTKGEYGWDGWLGPYFSNHPDQNMSILLMIQMTNTGTGPLLRKLKNIVTSTLVD